MKTKLIILWAVMIVLTVGVYAKTVSIWLRCDVPKEWSINTLYSEKWNCVLYKSDLIRKWNLLYQENKDYSNIKKEISDVEDKIKLIDDIIKNKIPRSFR